MILMTSSTFTAASSFLGSGTQIVPGARIWRRAYAMDLAPEFVDAGRIRWTHFARTAGIEPGPGALGEKS